MVENIAPGADGQANHTLSVLRGGTQNGALVSDVSFLPGLKLNADPALELSGSYHSPAGRLLEFDAKTGPNPGGWIGLHLDIPAVDLRSAGVVGFAARFAAAEIMVARVCLRSGTDGGFEDCFFDKHLLLRPEEASHVDALPIHQREALPVRAPWRELVIFLPTRSFKFSLIDLRVFIV
jgi:hypothetical protein